MNKTVIEGIKNSIVVFAIALLLLTSFIAEGYTRTSTSWGKEDCVKYSGTYTTTFHCQTVTKNRLYVRPTTTDLQKAVGKAVLTYRQLQKYIVFVIIIEQPSDCEILKGLSDKLLYDINEIRWWTIETIGNTNCSVEITTV